MKADDSVARFVEECCVKDPAASTPGPDLYEAFVGWCPSEVVPSSVAFARRLHALGFPNGRRLKGNGPRLRDGLRLKTTPASERPRSLDNVAQFPSLVPALDPGRAAEPDRDDKPSESVELSSPPESLSPTAMAWFRQVTKDYDLEGHQLMFVTLAAQTWDLSQRLEQGIRDHREVYQKVNGDFAPRPEVTSYLKATTTLRQIVRELGFDLDHSGQDSSRPPRVTSARGKR